MKSSMVNLMRNRVVSGGIWTFIGRAVFAFSALLSNILLSRLLNSTEFGTYMLAFNIAFFGNIIGILGLNQSIIRFTTENLKLKRYSQAKRAVYISLRLGLIGAVVTMLLYIVLQQFVLSHFTDSLLLGKVALFTGMWIVASVIQQLIGETFRGLHHVKLAACFGGVLSNVLYIGCLGTVMLLGIHQLHLSTVVFMVSLTLLLNCLLGALVLRNRLKLLPHDDNARVPEVERVNRSMIFRVSFPIMLSNVAVFFLTSTDLWILGIFKNADQVAIYGSAVRLIATINFFGVLLNLVMATVISDKNASGQLKELEKTGKSVTTLLTLPAIVLVLIFILFGKTILGIVFGPFYSQAESILIVLSIGQVINLLVGPSALILTLTGNEKSMLKIASCTSVVTIVGAILAAKYSNSTGVALVMLMGLAIQNGLMLMTTKKKLGIMIYFSPVLLWRGAQAGWRRIYFRMKKKPREPVLNE
ncbi:lipopolysaccharide biosynthesis protein [Paenibacillus pini]